MLRTKLIILSWLLLLVPTLLLGVGAWQLLRHESTRLALRDSQSRAERLAAVAANLELALAEVEDGLMQGLATLDPQRLPQLLGDWRMQNPLVRNVFIWQAGRGLIFPAPEHPASDEERLFVRRFLPLFSGEIDWQQPRADRPAAPALPAKGQGSSYPSTAEQVVSERKVLRELASRAPSGAEPAGPNEAPRIQTESGWRSWYADDQLHLLGWYSRDNGARRYGVEVEMMALLSRLLGTLSLPPGSGETLALVDGNGHIFHQSGPFEITPETPAAPTRPLAGLPHWQLRIYRDPAHVGIGGSFVLIGGLLTASLLAAILLGGSLLLWQARRHQQDARRKTGFVSNVSHELKTPLTTIRMYAELLDEGKIATEEKRRNYLQTIVRESERLSRLVNNVLDFSRLEQGRKEFHLRDCDLAALANELLARQQLRLSEAGLSPICHFAADSLIVRTDPDAVEQILLNLLDNAIKYASDSGELQLQLLRDGGKIRLELCDAGPGISAAQREKIFDSFHRLDDSLTSTRPGTGLGLSIARQLARGLGGELDCRAATGGGSCFCLTLPTQGEEG